MKKKKRRKKKKRVALHQHRSAKAVFGKPHPAHRKHKKKSTQKAHEITLELDKNTGEKTWKKRSL